MRRTIHIKNKIWYYGKLRLGSPTYRLQNRLKISRNSGKVVISITAGGPFKIHDVGTHIRIYDGDTFFGSICNLVMTKVFFKPDGRKRYNVTVKRIKANS